MELTTARQVWAAAHEYPRQGARWPLAGIEAEAEAALAARETAGDGWVRLSGRTAAEESAVEAAFAAEAREQAAIRAAHDAATSFPRTVTGSVVRVRSGYGVADPHGRAPAQVLLRSMSARDLGRTVTVRVYDVYAQRVEVLC